MQYSVIIENRDGVWRAFIPALANLSAEGASKADALTEVKKSAEAYLTTVDITTIEIGAPPENSVIGSSPADFLQAIGMFAVDEEAMREHIEEIYAERRRQREEAELEETLIATDESVA